ncbi:uncharacterized protein C10orf67 homolog, mitochondrial [Candoia aspera]|uniref:uncharacterized protein C10orf67 homolog, mitochondrial n=1 Tax=Candoia aspera TaxID=51853 RepID=UPI002FD7FEA1
MDRHDNSTETSGVLKMTQPCISEDLKIGFGISDHATQTDISEIGDLKQFTAMTRTLLQFTDSLCDDFALYKNILKMQYEEKIQEYATKLWLEISDRLKDVEELYKQKEIKTRCSYQQQLSDALAVLRMNYSKYLQVDEQCRAESATATVEKLRRRIDGQAAQIEYLTQLLEEEKELRAEKLEREGYMELDLHWQQMRDLREQITSLLEKNTQLQETVKQGAKEHSDLETEIKHMQNKRETDMKAMERLMNAQEILKLELDREKQRVLAKAQELKEAQDALAKLKETAAPPVPKKALAHEAKLEKKQRKILKGKPGKDAAAKDAATKVAALEPATSKDAAAAKDAATDRDAATKGDGTGEILDETTAAERKALCDEIKRLKKAEQQARLHIERLNRELHQLNQSWEMKFDILKKSLHAIKNEMFLRQSLRQSVKFRRPLLAERKPSPIHIQKRNQNPPHKRRWISSTLYMPYSALPEITTEIDIDTNEEDENDANIPVTASVPSAVKGATVGQAWQGRSASADELVSVRKIQFFSLCQPPKKRFRRGDGVLPFAAPSGCPQPPSHLCPARSGLRPARDNGAPLGDFHAQRCPSRRRPFLGGLFLADQTFESKNGGVKVPAGGPPLPGASRAAFLPSPPGPERLGEKQDACASPAGDPPSRSPLACGAFG